MPFDIHIQGCHMRSRDIVCPGKTPSLVSADGTDRVSLGYMIGQRMDPIWDTADAERSMVGIAGTYERPVE